MRAFRILSSFLAEICKSERGGGKIVLLFPEYDGYENDNRCNIWEYLVNCRWNERELIVITHNHQRADD